MLGHVRSGCRKETKGKGFDRQPASLLGFIYFHWCVEFHCEYITSYLVTSVQMEIGDFL